MEQNPNIGVSGGTMEVCNERLKILNVRKYNLTDNAIRKKIFFYSPFSHPATIWRRNTMIKAGKYGEYFDRAEDYDLYFRVGMIAKFGNLPDILIRYRMSKSSLSFVSVKRHELMTLYARFKAVIEYKYKINFFEKIYLIGQFFSIYLIPYRLKNYLFNLLRK
jgi:hypothetical protein